MNVPSLKIKAFRAVGMPVTTPVTKFGGQPVWIDTPQWPVGRTLGMPMQFVCQIELYPKIFGQLPGRMAYLFVSGSDEEHSTSFWDAHSGDNAVIIQPGGLCPVQTLAIATGPTLEPHEYIPELESAEDPPRPISLADSECTEADLQRMGGHKIGGTPLFLDAVEYPDESGHWRLLLQIDEDVPFAINCCLGTGYAFIDQSGLHGTYLCQSG
ncbi:MAG: DUF1963 domain-containing protein [Aphanocapsa lilacina HA4352-LM1]|jgi:uncharacterized protein YwqG|nr:DUF1963 domain-containing protein [Aphanocapsa lilacina HA4352-LM1]